MRTEAETRRRRIFEIIEVGAGDDKISRAYDFISALLIVIYLAVSILDTYDAIRAEIGWLLGTIEALLVVFFTVDYILRVYTAKYLHPDRTPGGAIVRYIFSFAGIIDLLSFLPYYLPFFFPAGAIAFRMFRVIRIFRLFRINTYYDSLNVITEVLSAKKQQLISSVFIISVMMIASSLCMYSLEHEAQPEVFRNAFSGIWWSVSTLLTVGYGDIYPITTLGKVFSIVITFLGVGMVAIPTGIISAGFVEQYSEMKKRGEYIEESDVRFMKIHLDPGDVWVGRTIGDVQALLPQGMLIAAVRRGGETLLPKSDTILLIDDVVVVGAEPVRDHENLDLTEITLGAHNPWVGQKIRNLDISRRTLVVMVRRGEEVIIPDGDLAFAQGDKVFLYTARRVDGAEKIRV
ncbi:MAG: potassium channel protein [Lachnospiraceae bacterium]|nr:potassium channel protein [Lachnospiraceae bacterium]